MPGGLPRQIVIVTSYCFCCYPEPRIVYCLLCCSAQLPMATGPYLCHLWRRPPTNNNEYLTVIFNSQVFRFGVFEDHDFESAKGFAKLRTSKLFISVALHLGQMRLLHIFQVAFSKRSWQSTGFDFHLEAQQQHILQPVTVRCYNVKILTVEDFLYHAK